MLVPGEVAVSDAGEWYDFGALLGEVHGEVGDDKDAERLSSIGDVICSGRIAVANVAEEQEPA